MTPAFRSLTRLAMLAPLAGCGLSVPKMQPFQPREKDALYEGLKESSLIDSIKCDLHLAVQMMLSLDQKDQENTEKDPTHYPSHPSVAWLNKWGATVSLKMIVDEKSVLAPGITFSSPMENVVSMFAHGGNVTAGQSFSLGIGANLSSDATRTENLSFYYPFSDLLAEGSVDKTVCKGSTKSTIDADLRIEDFLQSKYEMVTTGKLLLHKKGVPTDGSVSPLDTLTYETQFVVAESVNGNPAWKLIRLSANTPGPLLTLARQRTDDVLITMGETTKDDKGKTTGQSLQANYQLEANLIGQAVASAIRNTP